MFGFGIGEILLVLALLVLLFGAKRIPQIARGVGEGIRNFRTSIKEENGERDQLESESEGTRRLDDGQDR